MQRRFGFAVLAFLAFILAACGDATVTSTTTSANATPVAAAGSTGTMTPGMAMGQGTMTPAMTMGQGTAMPGMTMAPGVTMSTPTPDAMTASLLNLSGQAFETTFMQEMIAHHQGAVDMAKLVPTNTTRPELLSLSKDIIASQSDEISQMTGWLTTWYAAKPLADPMSAPGMMDMMGGMDQLKTAKAAAFDKMFIQMMVPHHEAAVAMATVALQKATHPELKTLAQNIISAQTKEIGEMQGWLSAWFKS